MGTTARSEMISDVEIVDAAGLTMGCVVDIDISEIASGRPLAG